MDSRREFPFHRPGLVDPSAVDTGHRMINRPFGGFGPVPLRGAPNAPDFGPTVAVAGPDRRPGDRANGDGHNSSLLFRLPFILHILSCFT